MVWVGVMRTPQDTVEVGGLRLLELVLQASSTVALAVNV